jgi:hypothetical protein
MNEVACRRQGNVWRNPGSGSDKAMIPVRRLVVPDSRTTSRTIAVSLAPGDPVWLASERLTAAGGHRRADVLTRTQRLAGGEGVTRTLDCHAGLTARPRKRHRVPLARSHCGRGRSRGTPRRLPQLRRAGSPIYRPLPIRPKSVRPGNRAIVLLAGPTLNLLSH